MIDFAMPYGTRVDHKEVEKIEKYLNLARELKKMWNTKAPVVLFVVAALGTPAKALEKRLKTIGIETKLTELQKTVLIQICRILRKVLEVRVVLLTPCLKSERYLLVETNMRPYNNNNNNNNNNNINNNINNNNNNNNNNNSNKNYRNTKINIKISVQS